VVDLKLFRASDFPTQTDRRRFLEQSFSGMKEVDLWGLFIHFYSDVFADRGTALWSENKPENSVLSNRYIHRAVIGYVSDPVNLEARSSCDFPTQVNWAAVANEGAVGGEAVNGRPINGLQDGLPLTVGGPG